LITAKERSCLEHLAAFIYIYIYYLFYKQNQFKFFFFFFLSPSHILDYEYVRIFELHPHLIGWFKSMFANHEISDPKLPEMPSSKGLKRMILVDLRCVDPNVNQRPKMGDLVVSASGDHDDLHEQNK
jgi:hypothetical protein